MADPPSLRSVSGADRRRWGVSASNIAVDDSDGQKAQDQNGLERQRTTIAEPLSFGYLSLVDSKRP